MRVTGLGKIVIFLLILGAAVGGWRAFQSKSGGNNGSGNNGAPLDFPYEALNAAAFQGRTYVARMPAQ